MHKRDSAVDTSDKLKGLIASLGGVKVLSTTPYVARKDDFLAGRGAGEFTRVNFVRFAEAAFERIPSPRRVSIH